MDRARSLEESLRLFCILLRAIGLILGAQFVDDDAIVGENDLWHRCVRELFFGRQRVNLDQLEFVRHINRLIYELLCLPHTELRSILIATIDESEYWLVSNALLGLPGLLTRDRNRSEVP